MGEIIQSNTIRPLLDEVRESHESLGEQDLQNCCTRLLAAMRTPEYRELLGGRVIIIVKPRYVDSISTKVEVFQGEMLDCGDPIRIFSQRNVDGAIQFAISEGYTDIFLTPVVQRIPGSVRRHVTLKLYATLPVAHDGDALIEELRDKVQKQVG